MALVWLVAAVAMTVGGIRAARHRADAVADLAALAAAAQVINGSERACAVAGAIAREARARLVQCVVRDSVVDVRVTVTTNLPGLGPVQVPSRARAGPARTPSAGWWAVCADDPHCHWTVLFVTDEFGTLP
jgi:secretion/DNA translocation related TadE-like protein